MRANISAFGSKVAAARTSLRARPYVEWSTGAHAAYTALDAAATELAKLRKECDRFVELARMFDLTGGAREGPGVIAGGRMRSGTRVTRGQAHVSARAATSDESCHAVRNNVATRRLQTQSTLLWISSARHGRTWRPSRTCGTARRWVGRWVCRWLVGW
jgi:hypothetical protein